MQKKKLIISLIVIIVLLVGFGVYAIIKDKSVRDKDNKILATITPQDENLKFLQVFDVYPSSGDNLIIAGYKTNAMDGLWCDASKKIELEYNRLEQFKVEDNAFLNNGTNVLSLQEFVTRYKESGNDVFSASIVIILLDVDKRIINIVHNTQE